jgi:hypothetical protein
MIDACRQEKASLRATINTLRMSEGKAPVDPSYIKEADDSLAKSKATLRGYVVQKAEVQAFLDRLLQNNVEIEARNM